MSLYFIISILIAFCLECEQYDMHNIEMITKGDWLKIIIKSSIPALISLRAFLDTSLVDLPHPKVNIKTIDTK